MTKAFVGFFCGLFALGLAFAASAAPLLGSGFLQGPIAPTSSYLGPGDIVAHTAFYSCARPYNNAYALAQGNLCKLRNTSTAETCNEPTTIAGAPGLMSGCSASSNGVSLATFCASGCTVAEAYDQTGNGWHIVQATTANQPTLVLNLLNSLPGMSLGGASVALLAATNITPVTGVATLDGVFNRSAGTGNPVLIRENGVNNRILGDNAVANKMQVAATGSIIATANDAVWHSTLGVINGASAGLEIDGVNTTGTATGVTTAGAPGFNGAASTTAETLEAGFVDNVALNSTQLTNVCRNQQAAYGGGSNFGATC